MGLWKALLGLALAAAQRGAWTPPAEKSRSEAKQELALRPFPAEGDWVGCPS